MTRVKTYQQVDKYGKEYYGKSGKQGPGNLLLFNNEQYYIAINIE